MFGFIVLISIILILIFLIMRLIRYLHGVVESRQLRNKTAEIEQLLAEARRRLRDDLSEHSQQAVRELEKRRLDFESYRHDRRAEWANRPSALITGKLTIYHYTLIFTIASFLGLVLETLFTLIIAGFLESRVGLVWGPFSPIYGFGAVLLTMALWQFRDSNPLKIFLIAALVGSGLEQITGMFMHTVLNAVSWNYSHLPDAISAFVAWRFTISWGLLGLFWIKLVVPELVRAIGQPNTSFKRVIVSLLAVFLILDIAMTAAVFERKEERDKGVVSDSIVETYIDKHMGDSFIGMKFQNVQFYK